MFPVVSGAGAAQQHVRLHSPFAEFPDNMYVFRLFLTQHCSTLEQFLNTQTQASGSK